MQISRQSYPKKREFSVESVENPSNPYKIRVSERVYNRDNRKTERSRKNEEANEL